MSKVTLADRSSGKTFEHEDLSKAIAAAANLKNYAVSDDTGAMIHLVEDGKIAVDGTKAAAPASSSQRQTPKPKADD